MGLIRGILLVLVCILLFFFVFFTGVFATLNSSLSFNVVKSQANPFMQDFVESHVDKEIINNQNLILNNQCLNEIEYIFKDDFTNYTFAVPCEVILNGTEAIINYEANSLIEKYYYEEYNCDFWKCFKEVETPLFLVSQYSADYWKSRYYNFLFISILFMGLLFLLIRNKINFPIVLGFLVSLSFVPISFLDSIGKFFLRIIFSLMKGAFNSAGSIDISSFVLIFFSKADDVFWTGFLIGLILIAIGFFIRLIKVGFKLSHLFKIEWGAKKKEEELSKKDKEKKYSKNKKGEIEFVE